MAFWTKLFRRTKGSTLRCGKCGKSLQVETTGATSRTGDDPFADAVRQVAGVLATPAYVCRQCGTAVCVGCLPIGESNPSCPKCGSTDTSGFADSRSQDKTPSPATRPKAIGLVDNGDGTLTDHTAGLMWQKDDDGIERTQQDAFAYCGALSLAGLHDWRLPHLSDFRSLQKAAASSSATVSTVCSPKGDVYWTATDPPPTLPSNVAYAADGTTFFRTNKYYVRAVRSCR